MTIAGWVVFATAAVCLILGAIVGAVLCENILARITIPIICVLATIGVLIGMLWYFGNTASGQRAMVDQQSDLGNGLNRIVRVYTANGDIIAEFEGKIDIEGNDGGYVLFDYEGKRYIYYNCFVESIAEIGGYHEGDTFPRFPPLRRPGHYCGGWGENQRGVGVWESVFK